jgi:hypothetical protein
MIKQAWDSIKIQPLLHIKGIKIQSSMKIRNPLKGEDKKMKREPLNIFFNKKAHPPKGKGNSMIIMNRPNRYQHIFLGNFYSCNKFGHKAVHCKAYRKYKPKNVQRYNNNNNDREKINYNSLSPL